MNEINVYLFTLLLSLAIQIILFGIAYKFKSDKLTDFSYGMTFIVIVLLLLIRNQTFFISQIILATAVIFWGLRLSFYLVVRIFKTRKDARFDEFRDKFFKFLSFWILQGLSVWVILLPAIYVLSEKEEKFNFGTMLLAMVVWTSGFLIEAISDHQKYLFKSKAENKNKWLETGLWKFSRHPNYFGEILCWIGIFLFTLPYLSGFNFVLIISPIYIAFLLIFVSGIPILEKRYDEKFGNNSEYQKYKKRTSLIVPLPVKS